MKKILLISALCLLSAGVNAATCNGGHTFTGNTTGSYCISDMQMNWWSGWAWCKANGMHLATWEEVCGTGSVPGNSCPNIKGAGTNWAWTATPYGSSYACHVNLSTGSGDSGLNRASSNIIVCSS